MADTEVVYNPFEPGFVEDPYTRYAAMRAGDPIHHSQLEFWALFAYEDILRFLRDPSLSVKASPRSDGSWMATRPDSMM